MVYELESSRHVPVAPQAVYSLISDVPRTGEWSEQTHHVQWNSEARGEGATFIGHNRTAVREWTTVSTVVTDVPGEEFSWSVGDAEVVWGYRMRPAPGGCTLSEFTRFGQHSEEVFAQRFPEDAAAQIETRRQAALAGMPLTLARIASLLTLDAPTA